MARVLVLFLSLLFLGCQVDTKTGKGAASLIGRGVVNNPSNKSLRFDMLKFGLSEFCKELLHTGTPLRLADGQPVMGRYFGEKCEATSMDNLEKNTILVQFGGRGYAWTAGTGRLGFRAQGLLELAPDFRIHQEAMYVYFRPVQVDTSDFELLMTERPLAQAAAQIAGLNEEELGKAIISAQLGRGFTAIRYDTDGHTDFALGIVDPGERPFRHFEVERSPRMTTANGRTELFVDQQDFLGRIHVDKGDSVTVTLHLEGAPKVDFALLSDKSGWPYLMDYLDKPGVHAPKVVPTFQSVATDAALTRAQVQVPAGDYFLIIDHTSALGATNPSADALPARVDYLVQTGPADDKAK